MIITIIGKRLTSGVDKKTGKVNTNCVIHFGYKNSDVEGLAVGTKWISANCCPHGAIHVGEEYELQEFNNFVVKLVPIENVY